VQRRCADRIVFARITARLLDEASGTNVAGRGIIVLSVIEDERGR
jgi:hypothetical protein